MNEIKLSDVDASIQAEQDAILAQSVADKGGIVSPLDLMERVEKFYKVGFASGVEILQYPEFSRHYRIARRELNIVTGIPGSGKSEFLDQLLICLSREYGRKFVFFSPENYPHEIHVEKLLSKFILKPFHQGPRERMSLTDIAEAMPLLNNHFEFISADLEDTNLDFLLNKFKERIKMDRNIAGVIIDPWNEVESSKPKEMSDTEYVGVSLMKCRRFARENNVAMWIVAHPTKQARADNGQTEVPRAYDIAGSANWFNKADNILCVHRNPDNSVSVHIQKIKYKVRGMVGTVDFMYDISTGCYTEKGVDINAFGD